MRSHDEFKGLVDEKYKNLVVKRQKNIKQIISITCCLCVCFISLGVFIGNGGLGSFFSAESGVVVDESSQSVDNSSKTDINNSKATNSNDVVSSDKSDYSETSNDESSNDESNINDDSSGDVSQESSAPPDIEDTFIFVPDDYPYITGTVKLSADFSPILYPSQSPSEKPLGRDDSETKKGASEFSFDLFKNSYKTNENNIFSPSSALFSLGMVTNGANGETKEELINALCGTDSERLNNYLLYYRTRFGKYEDENMKYETAVNNAVWFDGSVSVDKSFLQTNADYYENDVFKTIIPSEGALNSVNGWINEKTNGLIKKMLDRLPETAKMILANTVYFEASWYEPLIKLEEKKPFYKENGETVDIDMLAGNADYYFEGNGYKGIVKEYNCNFDFIAILPNEASSVDAVIDNFTHNEFEYIINNKSNRYISINLTIPSFDIDCEYDLIPPLKNLGIESAFSSASADFSRMAKSADGNIFILSVLQKASVSLDENGTKAAAATVIISGPEEEPDPNYEIVNIDFDRPFIYMIVESETKLPVFIGTIETFV